MSDKEEIYTKEQQNEYYVQKLFFALIFDNNYDYYKGLTFVKNITFLTSFLQFIESLVDARIINDHIKKNIFNIIDSIRYIEDENSKERKQLINKIIYALNFSCDDNSLNFYAGEMYCRSGKRLSKEKLLNEIPYIEDSIFKDFIIILSHTNRVNDEDFANIYLKEFTDDIGYYESLNTILIECPSMFYDDVFKDRVNSVVELNHEMKTCKKENRILKSKIKQLKR